MAKASRKQIVSLKDERLDIDQIDHYRLSFFISDQSCQLAVKDVRKKRLLLLEDHPLDSDKSLIDQLDFLHEDHILISAGFWKEIQVFVRNNQFSLVPNAIFDKNMLKQYVRLNDSVDEERDFFHFKQIEDLNLHVAFGYEKALKDWFHNRYPKVVLRFHHQAQAFLNASYQQLKSNAPASLYLCLMDNKALIAGFNLQKLSLYNQFTFKSSEHLIKLTALSCQQFSAERNKTPLVLTGLKEQVTLLQPLLKKYFPLCEVGIRPDDLQMHPIFNELESYEYNEILANL